uniref:Alkaline protease n=1 Tax=uncultured Muribaculaceae bacterium TaxID=2301481 RepID=A0A6G8F3F1_9BACT|nr:alkaline protease [uncultured Muribaculaceae bacterium]
MAIAGLPATATVSLDSCRNMAVRNNKTIRMAEENLKGAGYYKDAARAAYLPGVDFTGTYMYNQHEIRLLGEDAKLPTMTFDPATQSFNYNILKGPDGQPIKDPSTGSYIPTEVAVIPKEAMSYDVHNVFAGALTLTQPVYMGGQIKALNEIAGYGELLAKAARNTLTQEVVYAVDEAYWLVVSLKEKKLLAESFVNLVDTLRYDVQAMLDAGVATRSDVLTVEVKLNEAKIALTKVNNGLTLSRMALAQLCGLPVNTKMQLEDEELKSVASAQAPTADINDVYTRRQDLEVIRQGINMLKGREKLTLGEMLPKIAIVGAYSFSNPNVINGFEKRFGGGFSIGAMVTVPIWHWGGDYKRYKAAKAQTTAQQLLLEDTEEKVNLQVSQAHFSFDEARKTYDMTVVNLDKADENLRQAELGFKEGVLTTNDVIGAQTAWLQANSEKIDAEIGIRLCQTYLRKVLGDLNY